MKTYAGRVKQFITLDAQIGHFVTVAVGSHRYEVEAITQGGHSYGNFGNKNAIAALADVIGKIYSITVPQKEGAKTTYNVGEIEGGTSVNTIAQSAKMLCEYRSNDRECLSIMQKHFADIFTAAQTDEVTLKITPVGERPCKGEVDLTVEQALVNAYCHAVAEVVGQEIVASPASTDANIPMSLGIASIDVGVYRGDGAHRREEWIEKDSVQDGLEIIIRMALALTNNNQ